MQLKYLTLSCLVSSSFLLNTSGSVLHKRTGSETYDIESSSKTKVLILGGGVAGVIAARTLHEQGIDDFLIIEARDELGGRLHSAPFGGKVVELGANWIQGTQTGQGPVNPIWTLAKKWKVNTALTDFDGSMATFDETGAVDFLDVFNKSVNAFDQFVDYSDERLVNNEIDLTGKTTYNLIGHTARNAHEKVAEYYNFDWEYAQKPDQSSAIATSLNSNFTFNPDAGGFSDDNYMSIDQRGYKTFIQEEAKSFLKQSQFRLNSVVKNVQWSESGVTVTLNDSTSISGAYAICTFSLGVLQHDDVKFIPTFPSYKREAIATMTMGTYTKIFLQFPKKFWFDTQFALYADEERGRYPVWQSMDVEGFMPGSGIIFVTVTGDFSERIEVMSDDEVKAEVMGVLRAMYPHITIPEPLNFLFPRWFSDPLYRGSYSNWPPSFVKQHHDNLRANVGRLYFAGEATSRDYYGYLQGAYFEGVDIANEVAKCVKGKGCVNLQHYADIKNTVPY